MRARKEPAEALLEEPTYRLYTPAPSNDSADLDT